jgi:hypothetical protein
MPAAVTAAISFIEVIFFGKNNPSFGAHVIILSFNQRLHPGDISLLTINPVLGSVVPPLTGNINDEFDSIRRYQATRNVSLCSTPLIDPVARKDRPYPEEPPVYTG